MRDILVTLIVFGSLPFILARPYIGILMWVWISVMNPHMQSWGFATTFPFAAIIAATTFVSMLISKDAKQLPNTSLTWALFAFAIWMTITTVFAFHIGPSFEMWSRVMKILLMIIVTMMLIKTRRHIELTIWMIVLSLAYYGVKGGVFTLLSGGSFLVWGPANTFIGGNNEIALALVMIIPLMHYLQLVAQRKWLRHAMTIAMLLCAVAALGSYSRGALLAIAAMGGLMWLKSRHKVLLGVALLVTAPLLITFMPDQWSARMNTINTYDSDASALGRINAWQMTYNIAVDRPLVGGGYAIYDAQTYLRYAPDPTHHRAAHSIYFQALGEHGFVGLGLYLLLGWITWRNGRWIIRRTAKLPEYKWAADLASMLQVSLAGFAVGGAFLSLLYFDVPYYLMAVMVAVRQLLAQQLKQPVATVYQCPRGVASVTPLPSGSRAATARRFID